MKSLNHVSVSEQLEIAMLRELWILLIIRLAWKLLEATSLDFVNVKIADLPRRLVVDMNHLLAWRLVQSEKTCHFQLFQIIISEKKIYYSMPFHFFIIY